MKEFDYDLDYKSLDFTDPETRKLYRIGRGEQGVLLVRPYTNYICCYWRFVDAPTATKSANKIYEMFCDFTGSNIPPWKYTSLDGANQTGPAMSCVVIEPAGSRVNDAG